MMLTGIVIEQADGPDRAPSTGLRGCRFYPVSSKKGADQPDDGVAHPCFSRAFFHTRGAPADCHFPLAPNRGGSAGQTMGALAPGTPQPHDEWHDFGDDPSSLGAPASPDRWTIPSTRTPSTRTATGTSAIHRARHLVRGRSRRPPPRRRPRRPAGTTGSSTSTAPPSASARFTSSEPRTSRGTARATPSDSSERSAPTSSSSSSARRDAASSNRAPPTSQRTNPPVRRGWWRCGGAVRRCGGSFTRGYWP